MASPTEALEAARVLLLSRLGMDTPPRAFDQALTHPSYANEHRPRGVKDNQRLEFLGDGVLDLCVSEMLLETMPEADEGTLSRAYASLVNAEALAAWARAVEVGPALRVGKGAASDRDRTNVLADAVEALVAAVYLDGGLAAARRLVELIAKDAMERAAEITLRDPKTRLQELVQASGGIAPSYRVLSTEGPDHDRFFVVGVEIDGKLVAEGRGRNKKLADRAAAAAALAVRDDTSKEPPA